jgi:2-hydroxychromene-2-carboxylate isomerase
MTMAQRGSTPARPRLYFSFRSPYSWLAYRDLLQRHHPVAERLEWIPYWEPDEWTRRLLEEAGGRFLYAPMSRAKHLYILQDVRRLTAERGLDVTWPIDRSPCWEVAHLAYVVAERHGRGRAFIDRVYRARWQEGRDICDRETMGQIAAALGLEADVLKEASDDPGVRQEAIPALVRAYRDGVFGVPFFVDRFTKFWGLDRLEAFVSSLGTAPPSVGARPPVGPLDDPACFDDGHAGGCG